MRQLAAHCGVMFLALGVADRALGGLGLAASLALVLAIAVASPFVVRAFGVAPGPAAVTIEFHR